MTRFYVTMTWHDFPEGGSFGTVLEGKGHEDAELQCRLEMADTLHGERFNPADGDTDEDQETAADILASHGADWHLIDCFDLDHFINQHTAGNPEAMETKGPIELDAHTPPPWAIVRVGDRLLINGLRGFVCTLDQPPGSEQDANARVIVAAPDLFAAVKEYLRWVDSHGALAPAPSQINGKLRAASAKADRKETTL